MATITAIREAIASQLATIEGVQTHAYLLANPTPPTLMVFPAEVEYDAAMGRGLDRMSFTVQAHVGAQTDRGAQEKLDAMLAPSGATGSVKAAVEASRTLGGVVSDCRVASCTGYRMYQSPSGTAVLGAEWTLEVLAGA